VNRIAIAIFLSSFFLLRPFIMEFYGSLYPNDDFDYFAHSTSLAFGQFPSYKNEYLMGESNGPKCAIGTGLISAPFVFAFSLLDRINGSTIVQARTAQNVRTSWAVFGFIFASAFYFCLGCLLLYWSARSIVGPSLAVWAVILMVICQGMPLYAYRRPVFSHVPEFFLQSVFVYLFIKNEMSGGKLMRQWWSFALLGIGAGLISLVRYNNILFTIVWPLLFIRHDRWQKKNWVAASRNILHAYFSVVVLILIFKLWPEASNHYTTYPGIENELIVHASWQKFVERFGYILLAPDWGLIFTAPFMLLGAWGLMLLDVPWKKKYLIAASPLLINYYIIHITGYQSSYYGYRYMIASAFPLFVLPLAFLLKYIDGKIGRWWKFGAVLLALFPVMSMWCWEGNALVATSPIPTFFGKIDWGNSTYQIGVWQTVLNLKALGGIIYLGGIQYVHYLFYAAKTGLKVNPPFDLKTLIQTLMLYALPFVMVWIFKDVDSIAVNNKTCPARPGH
jgi:hypothetical protein